MSESAAINAYCQDAVAACGSAMAGITSYAAFKSQLDEWAQFTAADVADAATASNITLGGSTNFTSAVATIYYTINGKSSHMYLWARNYGKTAPGATLVSDFGSSTKAVLVVPGSGQNEGYAILNNSSTYENILYSTACATGDGWLYQYPGHDMRALQGQNGNKLLIDVIDNNLQNKGTALAHLILIELAVAMKFLRAAHTYSTYLPNYTKTAIIGLSKGAWPAMMGALITTPTACILASGVSNKEYDCIGFGQIGGNRNNLEGTWDQTTLVNAIKGSATKFYYTHSTTGNELALMKEEADDTTATACAGSNFTDNKHTEGHCYPSGTLTWLQAAMV